MGVAAWVLLGLFAGFFGSKIINRSGEGIVLDIALAVVGAVAGGFIFNLFGGEDVTGLDLYSLVVAVIGAVAVLIIHHAVVRRT